MDGTESGVVYFFFFGQYSVQCCTVISTPLLSISVASPPDKTVGLELENNVIIQSCPVLLIIGGVLGAHINVEHVARGHKACNAKGQKVERI